MPTAIPEMSLPHHHSTHMRSKLFLHMCRLFNTYDLGRPPPSKYHSPIPGTRHQEGAGHVCAGAQSEANGMPSPQEPDAS